MSDMPTFYERTTASDPSDVLSRLHAAGLGAFFRPRQVESVGIRYDQLRRLVSSGSVEQVGRGLYRFADAEVTENYSLANVCARAPGAIICLLSALGVYGIGTQLPHQVWIAIPHKSRVPTVPEVGLKIVRFSATALYHGVIPIEFEGVAARITNPARTIVDCFRFERLIGREAAMEAVKDALSRRIVTVDALARMLEALPSRRLVMVLEALLQ